jgi:hypothetical protein
VSGSGIPAPYPTGLIDLLKPRISPKLVRYIAEADAGEFNYRAQRDAINKILKSERIPLPLEWEPCESFSLIKWSEPDRNTDFIELSVREQHLARLFCCACLLAAYPQMRCHESEPSDNLPRLIESMIAVEPGWLRETREFVAWLKEHCDRADPRLEEHFTDANFCRIGLVIITTAIAGEPDDAEIVSSVNEIFDRKADSFLRSEQAWTWLFESSYFTQSAHIWSSLAERSLLHPPAGWTQEASDACRRLGEAVRRGSSDPNG